jgi:putative DNA primase/helicase
MPAPLDESQRPKKGSNIKVEQLVAFLDYYAVAVRSEPREISGGWQIEIECPWLEDHSDEARRDTVVTFIAGRGFGFRCLHSHCTERHWREFRAELEERNPGLDPYFSHLPTMTHSDIARSFIESHDDFVRVYDMENATGVWIPGTRWQLGDAGDALLRVAIRRFLDELHDRYTQPEPGKKDPRRALKQAAFVSGVLSEVKPWLPPKSSRGFDADPGILPLHDGRVADLRTGSTRPMGREDCQTRRIPVRPADVPTPRWNRFLREITCGDDELAAYIKRLMALCITGLALHLLVILHGRGRNGKGVLLRLMEKMLGGEQFAVCLRPEDVEYRGGSEDRNKRLMGRLRGKRLAYTGETVSGHLDWTLLKTLTGGDTLAGAELYKNTEGFQPSHTLILTTNDRPKLPPTVAFKERLRFVPFLGDFSRSKDFTLEDDLAQEMPGILLHLIKAAPAVFANGDQPPAAVREATDDIMDENDVGRPFIEQCLVEDADAVTSTPEMESAIRKFLGGLVLDNGVVDRIMDSVRARFTYGRKRTSSAQLRGFIGVRPRDPS